MVNIKRFIDRVSTMDQNPGKSLVLPIAEARQLRDEIVKLLADKLNDRQNAPAEVIEVQLGGGKFK
jgi:hypothetical protein